MLPEIGLTAQFEKKFKEFFGFNPALWHSGITKKNKKIIIKKSGIGNIIFQFAHNKPATYGILCIVFAVFAGLMGATIFRRL